MGKILNLSILQIALLLTLANVLVHGQVMGFEFVNFFDAFYLENDHVKKGLTWEGLTWAFSSPNFPQSLSWVFHMLDVELFGLNPAGHHAVNLLLHIANTIIFFLIINRLTGSRNKSAIAAILFAIHPLRGETVAWVADRQDLLAMLFALLSLEAYRRFVGNPNILRYALAALFFGLALLSNAVMVVLPFMFLLIDYWPLKRLSAEPVVMSESWQTLRKLLIEKIPLFLMVGLYLFVMVKGFDPQQTEGSSASVPWLVRLALIPVFYLKHLLHVLWPAQLSVFYPGSGAMPPLWQWGGSLLILLGLTYGVFTQWNRHPYLVVGWLWFIGSLLPMTGLFHTSKHAMADHHTYFPLIGVIILLVWGLSHWEFVRSRGEQVPAVAGGIVLLMLMTISFVQTSVWKNNISLYQHALAVDDTHPVAHNHMGLAWMGQHQPEKAVLHLKKAVSYCPDCVESWIQLGKSYKAMQKWQPAVDAYLEALQVNDDNVIAHEGLAALYHARGDGWLAIHHSRRAEAIYSRQYGPDFPKAVTLRQNLETYYQQYFLRPEDFASES